jgi:Beta-propeller repeat
MNRRRICSVCFIVMIIFFFSIPLASTDDHHQAPLPAASLMSDNPCPASQIIADLPLIFELNRGQADQKVKLLSRAGRSAIYLTPSEIMMEWSRPSPSPDEKSLLTSGKAGSARRQPQEPALLKMKFVGGNPVPDVIAEDQLPGKSHYFIGRDPKNWRTNIPQFSRGRYKDIYPGVDVVFYGNQRKLEFDFVVAAGSDAHSIKIAFEGAKNLEIDGQGNLEVSLGGDEILFHKPYCYQGSKEEGEEIDGQFILMSRSSVGFKVGAYDPERPLIIDPSLSYSALIGGSQGAAGQDYVEDDTGNIYFGGTVGEDGLFTVNPYQASYGGGLMDAYVGKLNAAGTAVVYATYLGGSGRDELDDIAVDKYGNAYVIGCTDSTNFPLVNPLQSTFGGSSIGMGDTFVTKLNSDGSALLYSTYLGGSADEQGQGIAVDVAGNAYIMGNTYSNNFPTKSPFQGARKGSNDVFLAKLDASGSALVYSTYLGGSGSDNDYGYGQGDIAVDDTGCAYLTGFTMSSDFPVKNAFQSKHGGGGQDAFVTKFNPSGSALVFSTYLGGSKGDHAWAIAVAPNGNVGVTGPTDSANFPTRNPFQAALVGTRDVFVTVLSPSGSDLVFSTYLGGTENVESFETSNDIAFSPSNTVGVVGRTDSKDFPVAAPIQGSFQGGNDDAFISVFSADGKSLAFSTYLGGSSDDDAYGVAFNDDGNLFVGGPTASPDFPKVNSPYDSGSIYIARIRMKVTGPVPKLDSISPTSAVAGDSDFTLTLTGSDFVSGCKVQWGSSARTTTFISAKKLTASIGAANLTTGVTIKVTVVNPGGGVSNSKTFNITDYSLSASSTSATVTAGQTAAYQLAMGSQFGSFNKTVSLSCSALPSKCSSSFSPASGTPGSGGFTSTLSITTTAPSASGLGTFAGTAGFPLSPLWPALAAMVLLGGSVLRAPRRRRMAAWLGAVLLFCWLGFSVSCESKSGGGDNSPTNPGTPKGTYTVTVTGTAGSLTRSLDLTLTVN